MGKIVFRTFGNASLIIVLSLCSLSSGHADSRVAAWGYNWYVNGGPNQFLPVPTPPANLTNVVSVSGGAGHSLALRRDGTVTVWGDNSLGQRRVPGGLSNVVAIAAGSWHNLALRSDGTVAAWGAGSVPETGGNNGLDLAQSVVPAGLTNAVAIAAGIGHSMALRSDGTVLVWGADLAGEAGVPPNLSNVVAIASGANHCLALKADGTVVSWGHYSLHPATNVPPDLTNVVGVAVGSDSHHSLALKADGTLVAWGEDDYFGQLDIPPGLSNVAAFAAGGLHNLALSGDGTVVAWGAGKVIDRSNWGDWGQSIVPANLTNAARRCRAVHHDSARRSDNPLRDGDLVADWRHRFTAVQLSMEIQRHRNIRRDQ